MDINIDNIEEARSQVRKINTEYKTDLMSEKTENEEQELNLVLNTSKKLKRKKIYLSLDTTDFNTIIKALELAAIKRRENYSFEDEEELDSGIIRYEYLLQKAKNKSVIITRNSDLNIIIYCIKKQFIDSIIADNQVSNNIDKIAYYEHLILKLKGKK